MVLRILVVLMLAGQAAAAAEAAPFAVKDVRLLAGPFLEDTQRDERYLLSLDPDRLLHTFRVNAGLPSAAQPLGGWEKPDCELRGHSLGHYLTAISLMYAATGDERFRERATKIVTGLVQVQNALPSKGFHPGYLSAYPESFIDRWDAGEKVWAPWYTLHKIMAGLLDDYEVFGDQRSLDILIKMAGWIKLRVGQRTQEQLQKSMNNEIGGISESLANLYGHTKNPDHLRLAEAFDHHAIIDPLARDVDPFDGKHANTQIPKLIAAARLYELTGDPKYRHIAEFAWSRVALARSFVHGGHSDDEHFFPVTDFAQHLGPTTAETCNTYNMLKLTRHLMAWHPSDDLAEFYERALFNHILSAQDPRDGMFVYFTTVMPGHFKTYSTPENSFWCCVGTGMENPARFGEGIYFHDDHALYVNLFIASELKWDAQGLVLRQETRFPDEDTSRFTVSAKRPVDLTFEIRHPRWAAGMAISVNGKPVEAGQPGTYVAIQRQWKQGDRIEIRTPMKIHTETLPGVPSMIAFLDGPIVLAGQLGRQGLDQIDDHAEDEEAYNKIPVGRVPALTSSDSSALIAHIQPVAGEALTFRTNGIGVPDDFTLKPMFRTHHERYSLYWNVLPAETK